MKQQSKNMYSLNYLLMIVFLSIVFVGKSQNSRNDSIIEYSIDSNVFLYITFDKNTKDTISQFTLRYDSLKEKKIIDGRYKYYDDNKIISEGILNDTIYRLLIDYYDNKILKSIYTYINDSTGFETNFYKSGVLQSSGYKLHWKKNKCWQYYDINGIFKKKECYKVIKVTSSNVVDIFKKYNLHSSSGYISVIDE